MECWVKKKGKKVCGVHFGRNFWKIFKNEDFGFDILEKGKIFRPFSGLAPLKLKCCSTKIRGRLCAFSIWVMGEGYNDPPPHNGIWVGKIGHERDG